MQQQAKSQINMTIWRLFMYHVAYHVAHHIINTPADALVAHAASSDHDLVSTHTSAAHTTRHGYAEAERTQVGRCRLKNPGNVRRR